MQRAVEITEIAVKRFAHEPSEAWRPFAAGLKPPGTPNAGDGELREVPPEKRDPASRGPRGQFEKTLGNISLVIK